MRRRRSAQIRVSQDFKDTLMSRKKKLMETEKMDKESIGDILELTMKEALRDFDKILEVKKKRRFLM